uniref:LIM zinc-binding domain-containing protein n=1 Tax=Pavo cristatus TaxID=9049 RepID=A0A8C9LBL0_PAVCR
MPPSNLGGSDVCYFCRKRVYVMERLSAEGKFFHRSCFKYPLLFFRCHLNEETHFSFK